MNSRVLGGAVRTVRYGYDAVGNRTTLEQANGVSSTTTYDQRNRLKQLLTRTAAGLLLFGATYEVDASGARTAIAEFDASGPTRSVSYAYDGTKRLVAETIARPGQADRTTRYVYDAVGNRLARTVSDGPGTTYAVDANDRLISETTGGITTLYTYDANGNTTGKAKPGEWTRYGYDEENRLVDTTTSAGASLATGYNADGIRNRETANGQTTTWLIDPNRDYAQTLEAYTGNQLRTAWVYGNELLSQASVQGGGLHERSLHTDGMGSVRQATDYAGQLTDAFEYDAFGNELTRTGNTDIDHRYRGEQLDPNTGFYNLRARWYDASSGRFATQDTWAGNGNDPISLHKYLYANAEPVRHLDPSGHATLAEVSRAPIIQMNLSNLSTITFNTARVAANDALWTGVGGNTGLLTALALAAAANEVDRFLGVPVIVFGREFPEHALHIGEAQIGLGSNFRPISPALNRFPVWPRGWYNSTSECGKNARARSGGVAACDEFPFASTRQGGPVNYAMWGVSLQLLSLAESSRSGNFIDSFYRGAFISPDGFSKQSRFLAMGIPGARSFYTDSVGAVHYFEGAGP